MWNYRKLAGEVIRFLGAGAANTVLGFLIYEILILFIPYPIGYTISFLFSIAFAAIVYSRFVFGLAFGLGALFRFFAFYLLYYVAGLSLLTLLVKYFRVHAAVAPLIVIVVLLPLSFLGSRLSLQSKGSR